MTVVASFIPARVNAGLIINEIMYDLPGTDTDHEWIEVYNDSSTEISLEGFKFNDGANHRLNTPPVNGGVGSLVVPGNGYVILSANASTFKSDYPSFSGTLIDTVMSLANEGDSLSLVDSNNDVIDSISYTKSQGGVGDGNSLGSFGSALSPGIPSPGKENSRTVTSEENSNEEKDVDTELTQDVVDEKVLPQYAGTIITKEPITASVPALFDSLIVNPDRKTILPGKYVWNFGDGTSYEYYGGGPFTHVFYDPGEYVIVFEFYKSKGAYSPEVVVKKIVSVGEAGVVISSIGTSSDPKVELTNTTSANIDMSSWKIASNGKYYLFPKNTVLLENNTMVLRPSVLGFVPVYSVQLFHPNGTKVSEKEISKPIYSVAEKSSFQPPISERVIETKSSSIEKTPGPVDPLDALKEIDSSMLSANSIQSFEKVSNTSFLNIVYYALLFVVVIVAIVVALKIRRKDRKENKSDDEMYDVDEFTFVE